MNELLWVVGIFATAMIGVVVLAVLVKLKELKGAQSWRVTSGRIVRSEVRAMQKRGENLRNKPLVEYEYSVDEKRYQGERVSLAEIISESDIEPILDRYPVGAQVTVYYDPSRPADSVLERAAPPNFGRGLAGLFILLGGGALLVLLTIAKVPDLLAPYLGEPENASVVTISAGLGVLLLVFGYAQKQQEFAMQAWNSTQGTVLSSEVRSFTEWKDGVQHTYFTPHIVYRYTVASHEYISDRYLLGTQIAWGDARIVAKEIDKHPVDSPILVFYNPRAPAESVLERRIRGGWSVWAVGVGLLLLAIYLAGIF